MVGRLDIHITQARIEFSSSYSKIDMRQPQPSLEITTQKGGIDIETQHPQLMIDSSACQAEEGDKTVFQFIADNARQGIQDAQEAASQYAQDGRYMLENFHSGGNVITGLARSKAFPPMKQSVFIFIPSQPPQVSFTDNVFDMNVRPDTIEVNWNVSPQADIELTQKGTVNIQMAQYPSVEFNYIEPAALDTTA
jgi:hypothetical protein